MLVDSLNGILLIACPQLKCINGCGLDTQLSNWKLPCSVRCVPAWYSDGRGFDPRARTTFLLGDWSLNNFFGIYLRTADSSRAAVSHWQKDVHLVLDNRLSLNLPRKSVVRLTDHLDMTTVFDWDVKPQNKQTNKLETAAIVERMQL